MCTCLGISRSGYYSSIHAATRETIAESIVLELVHEQRRRLPRIGGKKLYFLLQKDLHSLCKIGRDKFFEILRNNGLLVSRKKRYARTTNSYHHFYRWKNLLKDRCITCPNECYVSDITYLRTTSGFVYLFLITDYYSRKIVGWDLSRSLSIEGGINSLQMAIKQRKTTYELLHHSDRGIQYCSHDYVKLLQNNGIKISMTEENHCYENSLAERVNGILKDEFLLYNTFGSITEAHKAVKEAITLYNEVRPHWSLKLQTPDAIHQLVA
jgi:transposase InsO family protein